MFSLSLRRLAGVFGSAGSGRSEKRGFRPRLELLETRTVPSGGPITVHPPLNQISVEGHTQLFSLGGFTQNPPDNPWNVTVDWNDGTTTSFSTDLPGGVPPQLLPAQPHRYVEESNGHAPNADGTYHVMVTVTDRDSDQTGTGTFKITVADPFVLGTGVVFSSGPSLEGHVVAHFTDPGGPEGVFDDVNPDVSPDYSATINWGDGSGTSTGTISFNFMTNQFDVRGSHNYATTSVFIIRVTINHELSLPTTVFSTAVIPFGGGVATSPGDQSAVDNTVSVGASAAIPVSTSTTNTGADTVVQAGVAAGATTLTHDSDIVAVSTAPSDLNVNLGTWQVKAI
jgi:hypothetical protein